MPSCTDAGSQRWSRVLQYGFYVVGLFGFGFSPELLPAACALLYDFWGSLPCASCAQNSGGDPGELHYRGCCRDLALWCT